MDNTRTASLAAHGATPGPTPAHLVLSHCSHAPLAAGARFFLQDLAEVTIGRGTRFDRKRSEEDGGRLELTVPDEWVSRGHVRIRFEGSHWQLTDVGSKNGTLVNGVRVMSAPLSDGDVLTIGRTFWVFRDRQLHGTFDPLAGLETAGDQGADPSTLHTFFAPLTASFHRLRQVATSPVSILVTGETGTGKEIVSRAIHRESRRTGPFVAVNCGALPKSLIEAELFGVKRGAYTGATEDRPGLIRAASGGTLFLDEIGDLQLEAQAVLLRVLEEREVTPVGGTSPSKVDLRVVAATHRDLDAMVQDGTFRQDLLARLAGFRIHLPPLAARREDLGGIFGAALRRAAPELAERLTLERELSQWLFQHTWPGNVRELVQLVSTLVAVAAGNELRRADVPELDGVVDTVNDYVLQEPASLEPAPDPDTRARLEGLLRKWEGNTAAVARELGTSRSQVRRLAKRYGLELDAFRL